MATIRRRKFKFKVSYTCQVRRKGFRTIIKSFDTRKQAQKWARGIERKLDMGDFSDYSEASKLTLGDLLKRYRAENKHRLKKDWKNEEYKIGYILKDTISDTNRPSTGNPDGLPGAVVSTEISSENTNILQVKK